MITVHRPDFQGTPPPVLTLATRSPAGEPARLLLIDNGKAKAKSLLVHLASTLGEHAALSSVEVVSKPSAGSPLDESDVKALSQGADVVIAGVGDCGSCSACSLHDAIEFEQAGIPATVLITDVFIGNIARFAVTLGLPGYHSLVVPHPVAQKDDDHLQRLASSVAGAACRQLWATS